MAHLLWPLGMTLSRDHYHNLLFGLAQIECAVHTRQAASADTLNTAHSVTDTDTDTRERHTDTFD